MKKIHDTILTIPNTISYRKQPINLIEEDAWLFGHEYQKEIHGSRVALIGDASITVEGVVLVRNKEILTESLPTANASSWFDAKYLFLKKILGSYTSETEPLLLVYNAWLEGYFHWMTETIPRLFMAKDLLSQATLLLPKATYPIYSSRSAIKSFFSAYKPFATDQSFYMQSLEPFNIQKIRWVEPKEIIRAKQLYFAYPTAPSGNYNDALIKNINAFYHQYYLSTPEIEKLGNLFYVSRAKAPRRKVINETEIIEIFERYGIKTIYFEDYSFADQVRIAKQAKLIISLHGASLTNTMFMREGSCIFELKKEGDTHNHCYFSLANSLNVNYAYQYCKAEDSNKSVQDADVYVDIELLIKNIELINTL
jgi:hypothetical protein